MLKTEQNTTTMERRIRRAFRGSRHWSVCCITSVLNDAMPDSPVDVALRQGPRGDGQWPGFAKVYSNIERGAEKMATTPHVRLGQDHIDTMADLGSGHEERMKWRQMWLREYGYL